MPPPSIDCATCDSVLPLDFMHSALSASPTQSPYRQQNLLADAFISNASRAQSDGLSAALETADLRHRRQSEYPLIDTSMGSRYYRPQPNCFFVSISNGMRGMVVGSVFGGAMGKLISHLILYIILFKCLSYPISYFL